MAGAERPYLPIDHPRRPGGGSSGEAGARHSPATSDDDGLEGFHVFDREVVGRPVDNACSTEDASQNHVEKEPGKHSFCGDALHEHTGIWVPVSVPPMTEKDRVEWRRGFGPSGRYFPEGELYWELDEDSREMTMWDVFSDMTVAAKDKVVSVALCDFKKCGVSVLSNFFLQEAWKDMAQTLADASAGIATELLETEPTKWLPDSAATSCMLCGARFHPIMCSRHHCRFCGGVFCNGCSKGRSLMPPKFRSSEPQRVCDVCGVRLETIQPYLMNEVSRELATSDSGCDGPEYFEVLAEFPMGTCNGI